VAVDVIHVTKDVERTVDRLAGTLTPSGTLLMVEDLKQLAWVDLTFGLLDSWWSFDDGLRTDHPLLSLATWRELLSSRFGHVDVLRACLEMPIEDTVADEGLFVCANPRRTTGSEPVVLDLPVGAAVEDRMAELAEAGTAVVRFDTPPVLDPAQAEWFAAALLRVLRAAEEHPGLADIVIATPDAVMDGDTPRVLTAGSMAAALTRVAAAERRRVRALSLAVDTTDGLVEHVRTLMTHGHPYVNGAVLDGHLHLPHVVADEQESPAEAAEPDRDAAVLFGGTSEIAVAAAEWLHTRAGIDRLYLVGRADRSEQADELGTRLTGAEVTYLTADVTDPDAVRAVAETVSATSARPLVLNLAAVLRDGTIDGVGEDDLTAVFGPKVRGSHTIATAFRDHGARLVLFSSTSALLGNAGQAAHAMACAYLDGLAESDPATTASVQWGPWEDVGITARLGMNDRLRKAGENPSPAAVLLPELGRAASAGRGTAIAADLDSPAIRRLPFLAAMLPVLRAAEAATAPTTATAPGAGSDGDVVAWAVASVLGVPVDSVTPDRTLADNGVDSLHLIEVRSLLEQRTGVRVPLNTLTDAPSLAAVRDAVAPAATGQVVFYIAGIFGPLDAAPDLEDALDGSARLVTLSSPTRDADSPERLDLATVAGDLADRIEAEQPTGPVTVAGHSFGARLAYAVGVELRGRGRDLSRVVVIDGDPVAAAADQDATDAEFEALMDLRAGGALSERSRAVAHDAYRANCAIARSPQRDGELACPVLVVVPEQRADVGLDTSRVDELRTTGPTELGGTEIEIARVPGDHFTMLRSPNVTHLADHLTAENSDVRGVRI
jgi:thioesterase domain-containing protein/acyl carrier protein